MGEPVEQGAGQPLGTEDLGPLVERQVAGDHRGRALIALAEDLKQHLSAGLGQRHEAEFIDNQQLKLARCFWNRSKRFSSRASIGSCTNDAAVVNRTR